MMSRYTKQTISDTKDTDSRCEVGPACSENLSPILENAFCLEIRLFSQTPQ